MAKVKPLRSRTMTIEEVQKESLRLIKAIRTHLKRQSWQGGRTDQEFELEVLAPFETHIRQDALIAKMQRHPATPTGEE